MNYKYRRERNYINNKVLDAKNKLIELGYSTSDITKLISDKAGEVTIIEHSDSFVTDYQHWDRLVKHKREKAYQSKNKLLALLENKIIWKENAEEAHKKSKGRVKNPQYGIRNLREQDLNDTNIISVFESNLTRTIGIKQDELTDALLVVQIYYFDIFKDISFWGFTFKGEKYKYFTSSAGQIRKKKAVFIKESVWNQIETTIMCGLTIEKINSKGGNNANKHLAYLALSNSATDIWEEFDIDKSIVIDDFETNVYGTFDFVDESDYSITRKTDYIPICHTDGCGMALPSLGKKNFMIRPPWIKGLLSIFDFRKFIKVNNCSPIIKDIYGKEHDVIAEKIEVIFTKSQFKMANYYDSWDEYKYYFKKFNCKVGRCNIEEDRIKNAKINYQMLFHNLKKVNYNGFLTVELGFQYCTDPDPAAYRSLQYLRSQMIVNI